MKHKFTVFVPFQKQASTWTFLARSPQLSQRRLLVDRVFLWTKKLGLNQMTAFRATRFMDGFMDSHKILDGHLNIIVLTSIWVAAKFEESHKVLPKVKELEKLVDKEYKKEEFLSVELMILKHFQFGLMAIPVAADLVHALLLLYKNQPTRTPNRRITTVLPRRFSTKVTLKML